MVRLVRLSFIDYGNKKTAPICSINALIPKALEDYQETEDNENTLNEN